jgi:hypothetical protein
VTPHTLLTIVIPVVGGLATGFSTGLLTGILGTLRWIARRRDRGLTAMPVYTDDNNPTPGHVPLRGKEHLSKLGWLLLTLGVLGLLAGTISVLQSNSTSSCLQQYIERTTSTNQQRAEAAALDRQGLRQQIGVTREFNAAMIEGITNPPADQERARAEFLEKVRVWDTRLAEVDRLFQEAEAQRQLNPVPARPSC